MPGDADSRRWSVLPRDPRAERRLVEALGVPALVARVLAARGITDVEDARAFLSPSLERDWADPLCVPGMDAAVERVALALDRGETVAVFGDFDVDGMSSTCLLTLALRRLGGDVHPFIPHRFGEGYGLSREALARVRDACDPDLVVTVDNGIAAANEVAWLRELGVDVVVTDHHEPADLVPAGVPVTDPKLSPDCPSRELAGVGVALKLICELGARRGAPDLWLDYLDVAALGTLSDMMRLTGENRALVAAGIDLMRRRPRPGLAALAGTAGLDVAAVSADSLPFSLIPRLNAAGRMDSTDVALDLLLTDDVSEATVLAGRLEAINAERRETEAALAEAALAEAQRSYRGERAVVVGGRGWHEGVKGIVASRLVSRYHVPSIVFTVTEDGIARGSGRSVGSVDLFHAVEQCSDVLVRFGGHAGAVGVTCEASRLDEFRERLCAALDALPGDQFVDVGEVTAEVALPEISVESLDALELLQPFGQGNKKPVLAARGVTMRNRALVGADGAHLRFMATDGRSSVPAIMFRVPDPAAAAAYEGVCDLVFEAVNETWQGRTKPKLMVKDILIPAPSGERGRLGRFGADVDAGTPGDGGEGADGAEPPADARRRAELAALGEPTLTDELRRALIGDRPLLAAQRATLERLAAGRSCLAVMATGRGKSLIFHLHAARLAVARGEASVFVYPLRALVGDQSFHLRESLGSLGVRAEVLTGETPASERARVLGALASGEVDIVLTTPEFLAIHRSAFARGRVGFVVVDEAHHAGAAAPGSRDAYLELPSVLADLGDPVALAVTATADPAAASEICRLLGIDEGDVVVDRSVRENLLLDDARDALDRDALLARIVSTGEKCVVYVPTRERSVALVRMLRHCVPGLAARVALYHAGLSRDARRRVERAFRGDELACIVSTSAFGEGVNLPGIRHVVLYGLPLDRVEFNQMSGRAGRDGAPATVHLLFGPDDVRAGEAILASAAPARDDLVALYRTLLALFRTSGPVGLDDEGIARAARERDPLCALDAREVASGLSVFSELGFCAVTGWGASRRVAMASAPARMELTESACYLEGQRLQREYASFCRWALDAPADELLARLNRPITPNFGIIVS
ncbi:single-stranded-DNA-specific exonuclease RecJ [Thermophilibacter mediterraneus]|uniref:single-stranded-DNA-specific exonuclease RecJ n=1 Tax=Thermophilibacter mediterraneus TaxID=1871031 RepID=UPI003207E0B3